MVMVLFGIVGLKVIARWNINHENTAIYGDRAMGNYE
jgi:hypothetical protein